MRRQYAISLALYNYGGDRGGGKPADFQYLSHTVCKFSQVSNRTMTTNMQNMSKTSEHNAWPKHHQYIGDAGGKAGGRVVGFVVLSVASLELRSHRRRPLLYARTRESPCYYYFLQTKTSDTCIEPAGNRRTHVKLRKHIIELIPKSRGSQGIVLNSGEMLLA